MSRMKIMEKAPFTTMDVYESAYLTLKDFSPELKLKDDGKVIFHFEFTEALMKALMKYRSGDNVAANNFAQTVKLLKSRIFALKENDKNEKTFNNCT